MQHMAKQVLYLSFFSLPSLPGRLVEEGGRGGGRRLGCVGWEGVACRID